MSEAQVQLSAELEDLASDFSRRLRLARAAELARAGRLLNAEALLCPVGNAPSHHDELDLLARILVQQKRFAEAYRRWGQAFKRADDKEHIRKCILVLQDYVERDATRLRLMWTVGFALWVVLLIVVLSYLIWRWWP
jgi:hypothetical protein